MLSLYDFAFALASVYPEETKDKSFDDILYMYDVGRKKLNKRLEKSKKSVRFTAIGSCTR